MFKLLSFLFTILLSCTAAASAQSANPQKYSIHYVEKVCPGSPVYENKKLPAKARRLSSAKGNINLVYFEDVPDSIKTAISVAANLWESKITNNREIYIAVFFEPLEPETAMELEVYYYADVESELLGCPMALASQILDKQFGEEYSPDGTIIFNTGINWDCSFTGNMTGEYNMTTMASRGIARCLGFGSSVVPSSAKNYEYYYNWPSFFDKLLYSDSERLTDLEQNSDEMAAFIQSNNVYINTAYSTYKIYAPAVYDPGLSLSYFDDENSLMSYSLGKGNSALAIDENTIDVLRTIGWNLPETGLRIKSADISDNGIASSYIGHSFYIDRGDKSLSNYQWKFLLKNKTGQFELISSGSDETFTIEKIVSPDNYFINLNGDIEGRIECTYYIDGEMQNAVPFSLSMELEPAILSIDNVEKHHTSTYGFYLTFTVKYTGADNLVARVEEDYSFGERVYWSYEPYIAHVKTGIITNLYYSWVTVTVENQYGMIEKTLEFEPEYDNYNLDGNMSASTDAHSAAELIDKIQVVRLDGVLIYECSPEDYSTTQLLPGLYIKSELLNDGTVRNSKIVIQ